MFRIEFGDGSSLDNLGLNGTCYTTKENISEEYFEGKLSSVKIYEDENLKEELADAEISTLLAHPDGYNIFAFKELSEEEKTAKEIVSLKEENENLKNMVNELNDALLEVMFNQ